MCIRDRFWQVGTPYPFPEELAATFAEGLDEVLVLEELDHVLEDALLVHAGRTHATYEVRGRLTGDARDRGENDVDDCAARIARFLGIPQVIAPAAGAPSESYSASPVPAQPVSYTHLILEELLVCQAVQLLKAQILFAYGARRMHAGAQVQRCLLYTSIDAAHDVDYVRKSVR